MSELMPIDDYRKQKRDAWEYEKERHTGIACPKCGNEMFHNNRVVATYPPCMDITCRSCGHKETVPA